MEHGQQSMSFLCSETQASLQSLRTPESRTAEERLIASSARAFIERSAFPRTEAIESGDLEALRTLFAEAAEVGLTGLEIPEAYGGLGLGQVPAMLAMAELGRFASVSTALAAHFGIGSLPLVLLGDEAQKQRFLPELASADRIGAYLLTEPGAGSDALSVKTRAVRQPDASLRLSGHKQFITNAPIAGLLTVFGKVDGAFTAFVVPAETRGITVDPPEKKLGIRGALTAAVTFDEVRIEPDQILGDVGGGHRIAFNILSLGRVSLGFGALGCAKAALEHAALYATSRRQFGQSIAGFQIIRGKLAEMATRIYSLEGIAFRVAGAIDAALPGGLCSPPAVSVLRGFAAESALLKVIGSETAEHVVDSALQIHGGYGYCEDYPIARMYRDTRVNRIFEGTNEVNRLVIAGAAIKAALGGLFAAQGSCVPSETAGARGLSAALRYVIARVATAAVETYGDALERQQMLLSGLADLVAELYLLDTLAARAMAVDPTELQSAHMVCATERARQHVAATLIRLDACELLPPVLEATEPMALAIETVAAAALDEGC